MLGDYLLPLACCPFGRRSGNPFMARAAKAKQLFFAGKLKQSRMPGRLVLTRLLARRAFRAPVLTSCLVIARRTDAPVCSNHHSISLKRPVVTISGWWSIWPSSA
jgi:hypothetical protein